MPARAGTLFIHIRSVPIVHNGLSKNNPILLKNTFGVLQDIIGVSQNTFGVAQNTLGVIGDMPDIPPFFRRPSNTFYMAFQQVLGSLPAKIA